METKDMEYKLFLHGMNRNEYVDKILAGRYDDMSILTRLDVANRIKLYRFSESKKVFEGRLSICIRGNRVCAYWAPNTFPFKKVERIDYDPKSGMCKVYYTNKLSMRLQRLTALEEDNVYRFLSKLASEDIQDLDYNDLVQRFPIHEKNQMTCLFKDIMTKNKWVMRIRGKSLWEMGIPDSLVDDGE